MNFVRRWLQGSGEEEKCAEKEADAEAEAWSERTAVITRYDHETHCQLARSFVEDLADQVVKDHCDNQDKKEEGEEGGGVGVVVEQSVTTLQQQKQALFLPDLVPNVVTASQPPAPLPTESESDEYESADEQPLHDTLYLDSTVNPPSSASTPIVDTPGHQLDFDLSTFVLPGEATVDASTKEYSLPVVDQEPTTPQDGQAAVVDETAFAVTNEEIEEGKRDFEFVKPSDRRRSVLPFSPSSGSDVSGVESEADTLAAQTPVRQTPGDVDVDLISKFEKLVLIKKASTESISPSTAEGVEEPPASVASVDCAEPAEQQQADEDINLQAPEEPRKDALPEELKQPVNEEADGQAAPQSVEPSVPESEANEQKEAEPAVQAAQEEAPTPTEQAVEERDKEEHPAVVKPADIPLKEVARPEEKPIVPKKGYDLSFLDRFDDLENATPSISQLPLLPTDANPVDQEDDAADDDDDAGGGGHDQDITANDETPSVNPTTGEPTEEQEDPSEVSDSSFKADCTVKAVTPSTSPVKEDPAPPPSETEVETEVETAKKSEDEGQPSGPAGGSQEEELPLPKKGYDLSFLDKLEDLEHASPAAVAAVRHAKAKGGDVPKDETAMKDSSASDGSVVAPPSSSPTPPATATQPTSDAKPGSPAKKAVVRKPIRPKVARPAASTAKSDAFEVEFAFDPNEDPFKPKMKLGASPPRDQSGSQSDANSTMNAGDENTSGNEDGDNTTVIEADPDQQEDSTPTSASTDVAAAAKLPADVSEEEFRPAKEVFHDPSELDFLMQHGGCSKETALARQSLFVKFDPLVPGRPSSFQPRPSEGGTDETMTSDDKTAGRRSGGDSLFLFSPPHPSSSSSTSSSTSAAQHEKTRTDLSAAMRAGTPLSAATDIQPESLIAGRGLSDDVVSLIEHKEALKLQELLFQDRLLQKEREIQMKENEHHEIKAKLDATVEAQAQMRQIVGEYEKTISQLIAEKEREKANMEASLQATAKERDQAVEDLKEVERAFSEFHKMYERNRAAAESLHKNEEALKKALTAYQERLQQEQHKYETLKLHAAQKLEAAQQEMENMKRSLEAESSRVKAVLKKTEMRLASVETSLDQKTKENEELTKLCDELINKLGSSAK